MGPLSGIKIVEFAGLGPGPFCGMILADMGADVIVVDRIENYGKAKTNDLASRGKKSIAVDLKNPESKDLIHSLVKNVDALLEGLRPGKMEKLGYGPDDLLSINPKLIYGRMTGWGQTGSFSPEAGHDINYIALTGALGAMGSKDTPPFPPLNLVGDFGGGGMLLAMGICAALVESSKSGKGQVIDAAMTDGSALLMTMMYGMYSAGQWKDQRDSNLLDGAAHFYGCYECKDNKYISIGSIEPQFYAALIRCMQLDETTFNNQFDQKQWPELKKIVSERFKTRTRDEWCEIFKGNDVCFAPVLSLQESVNYQHNKDRKTFVEIAGINQPAPAPRFSRTESEVKHPPLKVGSNTQEIIDGLNLTMDTDFLISQNIIRLD
ncbi:CoA transferase [SAR86 cluster bacterium]|jgi:alpha-methylacyl-CoA racemase|nr:CoA transferase [SAR86 cluster bacterium]